MRAERPEALPGPESARDGEVRFRNRGRLPPLYVAFIVFLVGLYLSPLVTGDAPADPRYWWVLPLVIIGGFVLPFSVYLRRWSAPVTVTDGGLLVRGRLVVPAAQIGAVNLVDGGYASWASLTGTRTTPRVPSRHNLYGGGYGWGKGVGVEHVRHGGSTWWLLPGPRAEELAEALRAVRDDPARMPVSRDA